MSTLEKNRDRSNAPAAALIAARPFISVIMPVRNEAKAIANTLDSLLRQSYALERFEIIVVDGESTDNTREIVQGFVRAFRNVRLITNPLRWSSAARNLGVRAARGEYILIIDGHCEIGTDRYLQELADTFERTGADCIGRPQPLEIPAPTALQRAIGVARSSRLGHHPASHVFATRERTVPAHSVAVAYRREVFERVGLFDESFDACEDVELNHRVDLAGLRCVVVPALRVAYHPRATFSRLFQQMFRYGRGRLRLLRKHPETFSPLGFAPAAFLAFVVLGLGLAFCSKAFAIIYVSLIAVYLTVVAGYSCTLAFENRRWDLIGWLPAIFVTLHAGAGAGVIRELFRVPTKRGTHSSSLVDH